jgi:hypothetical protein
MVKRTARSGVLAGAIDGPERMDALYPPHPAVTGARLVHRASGFAGAFVAFDGDQIVVRGDLGLERRFRNDP